MATEGLDRDQLARILEVGRGLVSDLDLESVLRHVLEAARDLTSARYAAIGVLDDEKSELRRFIFTGVDEEAAALIGALPRGHGILGELIRNPEPLRLSNIGAHPRSYGFPPNHPPMTSFLGVPVMIRGEVFGNLYLTEKQAGDAFTEQDQDLLVVLAEWIAIAVDNARNYERAESRRAELERAVRGLQANASLSRELGGETDSGHVLELVAKRGRAFLDARSSAILLRQNDVFVIAERAGELGSEFCDRELPAEGSPAADVLRAGSGQRLQGTGMGWFAAAGITSAAAVLAPLTAQGRVDGVIAVLDPAGDRSAFTADDVLLLTSFATAAATAIASSRSFETEKRELTIESSERERRRWARELHDETLQDLGALKVLTESALQAGGDAQARALARATEQTERIITGLEGLITELRPAALDQLGPQPAVETLVDRLNERSQLEIGVDFDLAYEAGRARTRHTPEIEATIYRVVQEGLNNVIKHADAKTARVAVSEDDESVAITVVDDGRGPSDNGDRAGFGLLGMRERVVLAGGQMEFGPNPGGGTRLQVRLPAERRAEGTD